MKERLEAIKKAALEKIEQADAMDSLNDIRVSVLGKKGELTQEIFRTTDPLKMFREKMANEMNDLVSAEECDAIDEKCAKAIEAAKRYAMESPLPNEADYLKYVYEE